MSHEVPFFTDAIMIDIFAVKALNLHVNRADVKVNLSLSDEHLNVLIYYTEFYSEYYTEHFIRSLIL